MAFLFLKNEKPRIDIVARGGITTENIFDNLVSEKEKALFFGMDPVGFFLSHCKKPPRCNYVIMDNGGKWDGYSGWFAEEMGMLVYRIAPGEKEGSYFDPFCGAEGASASAICNDILTDVAKVVREYMDFDGHCADRSYLRKLAKDMSAEMGRMPAWRRSLSDVAGLHRGLMETPRKKITFFGEDIGLRTDEAMSRMGKQLEAGCFRAMLDAEGETPKWLRSNRRQDKAAVFDPRAGRGRPWAAFISCKDGEEMAAELVMLQAVKASKSQGCVILADRLPRVVPGIMDSLYGHTFLLARHDKAAEWVTSGPDGCRETRMWHQKYIGYSPIIVEKGHRMGADAKEVFCSLTGSREDEWAADGLYFRGSWPESTPLRSGRHRLVRRKPERMGGERIMTCRIKQKSLAALDARLAAGEDVFRPPMGRKGGRPRAAYGEKKLSTFSIRTTEEHKRQMEEMGEAFGLSSAGLVRALTRGGIMGSMGIVRP